MTFAFVGEKRSRKAVKMRVRWENGRLAAKQLFDALDPLGIDPRECVFFNFFERGGPTRARQLRESHTLVAMGRKVERALKQRNIPHLAIPHPAARGAIRKKEAYNARIAAVLRPQV